MRSRAGILGVLLVLGACTGGGTFVSGMGASSGASGAGVGGSTGASPPSPGTSEPGEPVEIPFVACSLGPVDGGSDADSAEAGGPDAGSSDPASPRTLDDAGPGDSHCFTPPPPECVGRASMVRFSAEGCDGERCIFIPDFVDCPGGCFRQVDGGERCNE